jgi:hypothetical protein
MAARSTRVRIVAAAATLGLVLAGLTALAWGSDVDDDGPQIESVSGTMTSVIVSFDEAIQPPTAGDFAFEHFGQGALNPHIHRPAGVEIVDERTVRLENISNALHDGVTLPLVAAYVKDRQGNTSRPEQSFKPES